MSRSHKGRVILGTAVSVGATLAIGSTAKADDIPVTTLDNTGSGSLREAIEAANDEPGTEDRILFQSGLSGRIELEFDLPDLEGPVAIEGPGAGQVTVDGNGEFDIFDTSSDASISGLTLTNGEAGFGGAIQSESSDLILDSVRLVDNYAEDGGAIWVANGSLDLKDSEVSGNTAALGGGIYASYTSMTISGSTVDDNEATGEQGMGGGLAAMGYLGVEVTIDDSEFTGNSALRGGGIASMGPKMTVDSSLIAGNTAEYSAGMALGFLGPVPTHDSIVNSTISGNVAEQAGGGITAVNDNLKVDSSTITGNEVTNPPFAFLSGAGLTSGAAGTEVTNSVISGNSPADLSTTPALTTPVVAPAGSVSGAFNLIGNRADANFTESVSGSNITSTDPQLGALADNGGPTKTMLPADTSPVVNKGSSALTVDQRGLTRPIDFNSIPFSTAAGANGADIGAVELQGGPLPPPPPPNPTCETDPALCPVPPPSNAFSFGWVKLNKKKGVASLQVKVPGAGKVLVVGSKTVAKFSRTTTKRSTVTMTIKAKGKAAKQLKKKGKAKVKASVKFTPTGGTAKAKSKTVKLVKKKAKKKR